VRPREQDRQGTIPCRLRGGGTGNLRRVSCKIALATLLPSPRRRPNRRGCGAGSTSEPSFDAGLPPNPGCGVTKKVPRCRLGRTTVLREGGGAPGRSELDLLKEIDAVPGSILPPNRAREQAPGPRPRGFFWLRRKARACAAGRVDREAALAPMIPPGTRRDIQSRLLAGRFRSPAARPAGGRFPGSGEASPGGQP
jgi:hypothetical protein